MNMRCASSVLVIIVLECAFVPQVVGAGPGQSWQDQAAMSASRQNELVAKRCLVCHDARQRKGGLSLEHFDAGNPDRSIAHLMTIKVAADNAMMAAGKPVPDSETVEAFVTALRTAVGSTP